MTIKAHAQAECTLLGSAGSSVGHMADVAHL